MQNTIVAVYDSFEHARDAMSELLANGFARGAVQLNPHADSSGVQRASSVAEQSEQHAQPHGSAIGDFFRSLFGMEDRPEHGDMYAEAIRRGSSVLTVLAAGDAQRDQAVAILRRFHPVDMDQRVEHWRRSGWSGYDAQAPTLSAAEIAQERASYPQGTAGGQQTGQQGLRPEDEVPRAGSVREGEQGFPQYGPVRVYAGTSADAIQHGAAPGRRNADFADTLASADDADYRAHWRNVYGSGGARYEDYDAAYRYGAMAASARFRNYRWDDAEPELRGEWEAQHPDQSWERVRDAVRYGAEKVIGREPGA